MHSTYAESAYIVDFTQSRPNRLGCLTGRFHGPQSRIERKTSSELLMNAHEDLIESFFNFTRNPLNIMSINRYNLHHCHFKVLDAV